MCVGLKLSRKDWSHPQYVQVFNYLDDAQDYLSWLIGDTWRLPQDEWGTADLKIEKVKPGVIALTHPAILSEDAWLIYYNIKVDAPWED